MAKNKKQRRFTPCDICLSPYRTEIEAMINAHIPQIEIAKKYLDKFPGCTKVQSLRRKVSRHIRHLDKARNFNVIKLPDDSPHAHMPRVSMEQFAQRMLEIGSKALDFYELCPSKIKLADVIATQRLLVEKQRLSIHEDALKLAMARFFGGFPVPKDSIEGEIINEPRFPKSPGAILPRDKE